VNQEFSMRWFPSRWLRVFAVVAVAVLVVAPVALAQTFTESLLVSLSGNAPPSYGTDPAYGPLIQASDGNFYGTASYGGANDVGNVFKVAPDGTYVDVYDFAGGTSDGAQPFSGVIEGTDGNFYGTTVNGGANGYGIVYQVTPGGVFTLLHSFAGGASGGEHPYAGLIQGTDGLLYGTTYGGNNTSGIVFKMSTTGSITLLHAFGGGLSDGAAPVGNLVQGSDGSFYGATSGGGSSGDGAVFKITSAGSFTYLHGFSGTDGYQPDAPLVEGPDGNFYSTTFLGGATAQGNVFKMTPGGTVTSLHAFVGGPTEGKYLSGGLVYGSDGNYYGTSQYGGGGPQEGTVFQITPSGTMTVLESFAGAPDDGDNAYAGMVEGADGNFYGTTFFGGTYSEGTVFKVAPKPAFGAPVELTLSETTVTGASSTPTGSVTYSVEGIAIGSANLNGSGVASFSASSNGIAPGTYPVVANYNGNSTYNDSDSKAVNVTLNKAATATALTSSASSVTPPADVTLTATVTRSASGATGHPGGSVTFTVDGATIATVKVNSAGVAVLKASSQGVTPAAYPIKAVYSGDASDIGSTSAAVTVTVK
jgi:uncharacterized repeat protein (TIGR03803 family)